VSLEEIKAGSQSVAIFGLGLLLVYLTLAGQYESLTLPFIILLSVPLAIMGALLAQWMRGLIDDVYCQIGLVMLIGLSAKNGILIVEFAEQLRARGMSIAEAAVEAARIRLRPILMTSLAFILGVMPLVFASGAGREARHSVGTAVAGGMIASTFLNLAFIPVLYVVVKSITERRRRRVPGAVCWVLGAGVGCGVLGARVAAQALTTPTPVIRVSFTDAIQRAQEKNPTVCCCRREHSPRRGPDPAGALGVAVSSLCECDIDDAQSRRGIRRRDGDAAQSADRDADGRRADFRGSGVGAARAGGGYEGGRRTGRC
jgi:hypothetical protein